MNIIIISITTIFVTQSIKIIWFYLNNKGNHPFLWPAFWLGGFPSSHTAVLASALYAIWRYDGMSLLFGFGFIISLLVLYGLLEDKKRQELFNKYFAESNDLSIKKIVSEGHLLSFSGHSFFEIITGVLIGIFVGIVISTLLG